MKIFLDTANLEAIRKYWELGVIDGVTTNPSLIAKEGMGFKELISKILEIVDGPVSIEAVSLDTQGIIREARELSKLSPNVVVKIPMIPQGIGAVKILSKEGIKTNVTLVFSSNQAILAAKAGASYVSPFIGRLDDIGHHGMQLVRDILKIFRNYGFQTQVIVASIRHPRHVIAAAKLGAHVLTIPPDVLDRMFTHPLTDRGLEMFLKDWEKVRV